MEELFKDLKDYKEPEFGSMEWLSVQAGYSKISKMIDEDVDLKKALKHLLAMSIRNVVGDL